MAGESGGFFFSDSRMHCTPGTKRKKNYVSLQPKDKEILHLVPVTSAHHQVHCEHYKWIEGDPWLNFLGCVTSSQETIP